MSRWTRLLVALAALAILIGTLAALWINRHDLASVSWIFTTAGTVISTVVTLVAFARWVVRQPIPITSSPAQLDEARKKLAEVVQAQWREEVASRQLDEPTPLAVVWRPADPNLMDHTAHVVPGDRLRFIGRTDRIAEMAEDFRGLRRRRLIIIGGAGTGKTTLAVLLLRQLLADSRPGEPVPVLLSLDSWDPNMESLHAWLVRRLSLEYPMLRSPVYGGSAPRDLVRGGKILPVLDGLDELPKNVRAQALSAMNTTMTDVDQLILTCRTNEYRDAVDAESSSVLKAAAVVSPTALTSEYIVRYLRSCASPARANKAVWKSLFKHLELSQSGPLAMALATPLALWLLRTVYIDTDNDPTELTDRSRFPTSQSVRDHLLDNLIEATILMRPPVSSASEYAAFRPHRHWQAEGVHRWLQFIAAHFKAMDTRDLAWWRLPYTLPRRRRRIVSGLLGGAGVGLCTGLASATAVGITAGVCVGLGVGLSMGLVAGLTIKLSVQDFGYANLGWLGRTRILLTRLALSLVVGLAVGVGIGLAAGLTATTAIGITLANGIVALVGGAVGLISGVRPEEATHANLKLNGRMWLLVKKLLIGFVLGTGSGLMVGVALVWLAYGFGFGVEIGLRIGLTGAGAAGLSVGIAFGLREWARIPVKSPLRATPLSTLRADLRIAFLTAFAIAAGIGLTFGPLYGWVFGTTFGLAVGFTGCFGSRQTGLIYLIAKTYLFLSGKVPWNLMAFLDDAHRLGLLRQVGAVYQFRHADLQDRLEYVHNLTA